MTGSQKAIFIGIMLAALILILIATGAGPILAGMVVSIGQAIGSFFQALIPK
jgi:hypothetical protein